MLLESKTTLEGALCILFSRITTQQNLRDVFFNELTDEEKLSYASHCGQALAVEVSELVSSWPFAPWKTTEIDKDNIEREIVDCVFFLVNIAMCFDVTPADLISRFDAVLENNYRRINNGTHMSVKL